MTPMHFEDDQGVDPYDDEHLERVISEILDAHDVYVAGPGPEGPWAYRSITVRRRMNRILVRDVDGRRADVLAVQDLDDDDPYGDLADRLDEIHTRTLEWL